MSRIEERVDRPFVVEVARMTVDSHDAGRRCQCCTDTSCPQDAWAQQVLAEHRAALAQTIPQRRPVAPDGRRSKEHNVSELKWRTLRCDNSGPNCPQIMQEGDTVYLRDSENPMDIAVFPVASFEVLKQKIRDGEV